MSKVTLNEEALNKLIAESINRVIKESIENGELDEGWLGDKWNQN